MSPSFSKLPKSVNALAAAAAISVVVAGCASSTTQNPSDSMPNEEVSVSSPEAMGGEQASVAGGDAAGTMETNGEQQYADGTYNATGHYVSPAGAESVDVTVTLEGGVVADAQFKGNATNPASVKNQGKFAAGFREQVVGKPIDQISLGVVNGSSLAPKGFMDALKQIKTEAQTAA